MDEIIGQAKDIKLMVPERIHPVIYKLVVTRKIRLIGRFSLFFYWIDNLSNSQGFNCLCDLRLLYLCSQLQTLAPENTISGKKMIGWKIDLLLWLRIFRGFWINYARSLRAEAMIFSVWHWPLLGQHPVAVIFFCSVDVCWSVFCVF